jgi:MFS family permease
MLAQSNLVVVLGWAVYDVARTSLDVKAASLRIGLIGLSQFPVLLINPFAGLVADRHDRRLVVRLALLAQILAVGVLVVLQALGRADLPVFYLVAAGFAAGRGFYAPAMNALAPALVPAEILPRAIAVSAIAGRIGGIVGPVLGGFAYGVAPDFAYGLTLALLCALLAQLAIGPHGANRPVADGKPLAHILEGLRYVAHNRMLLGAISLDLFAVLLGGATAMLPVYARDILHVGPAGLGLLRSASSVGAVSTALWLSWRPVENGVGPKMLAAVALFGVASAVFGISRWLPLSLAMLALAGAADMISVYVRQTLVQVVTPDAMRGAWGRHRPCSSPPPTNWGNGKRRGGGHSWPGWLSRVRRRERGGHRIRLGPAVPELRHVQRFDEVVAQA